MDRHILLNQIKTPDGTILISRNRHDMVTHIDAISGETYLVDGGLDYLRRSSDHIVPYEELSVYEDDPYEKVRSSVQRYNTRTEEWVLLKDIDDDWLANIISWLREGRDVNDDDFPIRLFIKEQNYRKIRNREESIDNVLK